MAASMLLLCLLHLHHHLAGARRPGRRQRVDSCNGLLLLLRNMVS
jgi:hypothetical protein